MTRRRFTFWLGFGLFSLAEQLRVDGLDELAATITRGTPDSKESTSTPSPVHWNVTDNKRWWWYERQNRIKGEWITTGITTPTNKKSGQPYVGTIDGYLDESLVPEEVRVASQRQPKDVSGEAAHGEDYGQPNSKRRARHGRPPSKWLRSLYADELRIWLKTIDVPAADVSGMTFWTHLTEDHSFDSEKIEGLTVPEQAKLHAAAHYGY